MKSRLCLADAVSPPGWPMSFREPEADLGPSLSMQKCRAAFTLIEMLVALAVIALLAAVGASALSRALKSAAITKSASQMLQIHQAALLWVNDNGGRLPVHTTWYSDIYPYLMNNQQPPPGFFVPLSTADNLKGTPFYCPLRERSGEGTPVRSYGWSSRLRALGSTAANPLPRALVSLREPSKSLMLATSKTASSVNELGNQFSIRCSGKVLLVFIDGHSEQRSLEDIPSDYLDVFWSPQ